MQALSVNNWVTATAVRILYLVPIIHDIDSLYAHNKHR